MTPSKTFRFALLIGASTLAAGISQAQTVAIPAGPRATTTETGQPAQGSGAQVSPLSDQAVTPSASAADPSSTTSAAAAGDIVVTGSRIVANGYRAPTPVTVVSTTELLKKAPESIAAGLARLPQFIGTAGTNVTSSQAGTPSAGNYLNLRRLGAIETLLLLDGQRLPPTSFDGTTDANIIPQALIQRVDVVTGGASAAYGSDAVAGVVNFILDTKFEGIKASAQYGKSSRWDNHQEKVGIAAGKSFFDNRLHLEGSFDYFYQPGIDNNGERPFGGNFTGGWVNVGANPARPCAAGTCAANPFTPMFNVRLANGTYGTLINAGRTAAQAELRAGTRAFSLTNFTFEPTIAGGAKSVNGVHLADLGTLTGTPNFNVGGADTAVTFGATLTSKLKTKQGFGRADYDFGGDVTGFLQGSYTDADTRYVTVGAGTQFQSFQIFADNAFLPAFVANTMRAEGVASFLASRVEADQFPKVVLTNNKAYTVLGGLKGSLFETMRWNVGFSHGKSTLKTRHFGNFNQPRWFASLDAVDEGQFRTGTRNGNVVCRINLTNPGLFPGCAPWNPFGNGSPSAASYSYFQDEPSRYSVDQQQTDLSANLSGSLFDLPAGPVSFALGGEVRRQKLNQRSNVDPSAPIPLYEPGFSESGTTNPANLNGVAEGLRTAANPFNLLWNSTNVGKSTGKQTIKEAFVEVAVPILRDTPFFQQLDLNGSVRYTNYSVTGTIWAWKVGGSWSPVEELRLRGTVSQDIRAPTLYELFQGIGSTRGTFTDIHTDSNTNLITLNQGNPNLKPEIARTITAGFIWQPSFFPRFSVSVDYYKIRIRDQITRPSTTLINQQCEDSGGTGPTCAFINRPFPFANRTPANFPLTISTVPFNQAFSKTSGFDFETNYRLPVGDGRIDLRLLGNYTPKFTQASSPGAIPTYLAGAAAGVPKLRGTASVDYTLGGLNFGIDLRYIGTLYYTKQPNVFVANNRLKPVTYLNANISYDLKIGGHETTLFLTGTNLTDKFVFAPQNNAQPTEFYPSFQSQYDVVGAYFVAGVRVRF